MAETEVEPEGRELVVCGKNAPIAARLEDFPGLLVPGHSIAGCQEPDGIIASLEAEAIGWRGQARRARVMRQLDCGCSRLLQDLQGALVVDAAPGISCFAVDHLTYLV